MSKVVAPFQLLELNIISAQDLAPVVSSSMKTYAVAWVNSDRKLSTGIDSSGNTNPTWNDKFVFRVDEEFLYNDASAIMIEFYALRSWLKDVLVGTVRVLVSNLVSRPSNYHHSSRPATKFVALQVRRPSGRPQGILNIGVTVLDSSMRSMPFYTDADASAVGYRHLMGEEDECAQRKTSRGTPMHPRASGTPERKMSRTPRHPMMGTTQHATSATPRTPRHRFAGTPQHPMSGTPRQRMATTPQHPNMYGTPRHAMTSGSLRHAAVGTPLHAMSGTPVHRKSGGTSMTRKLRSKTPLHTMSFTRHPEYETPSKSALMGDWIRADLPSMTNSESGRWPSEMDAAVAKVVKDGNESYVVGEWNFEENDSLEGLEPKHGWWKSELPLAVYDDKWDFQSYASSKPSRHARRHTDGGSASGLSSCFSPVSGVQFSIVYGGSKAKKTYQKVEKRRSSSSANVTSYL